MKAASTLLAVLAIIGALAAGALWYFVKGQKETLIAERDSLQVQKMQLEGVRADLTGQIADATTRITGLTNELNESKTRNTTLEARANQLNRDVMQARADAESAEAGKRAAIEESSTLRRQVQELTASLGGAEERIKSLESGASRFATIATNTDGAPAVTPLINTSVASVGPRSAFVVINAGSTQGIRNAMKLAINRDGEIVAQAVITETRENVSVAQIIPNTLSKEPRSGDSAYTVN